MNRRIRNRTYGGVGAWAGQPALATRSGFCVVRVFRGSILLEDRGIHEPREQSGRAGRQTCLLRRGEPTQTDRVMPWSSGELLRIPRVSRFDSVGGPRNTRTTRKACVHERPCSRMVTLTPALSLGGRGGWSPSSHPSPCEGEGECNPPSWDGRGMRGRMGERGQEPLPDERNTRPTGERTGEQRAKTGVSFAVAHARLRLFFFGHLLSSQHAGKPRPPRVRGFGEPPSLFPTASASRAEGRRRAGAT